MWLPGAGAFAVLVQETVLVCDRDGAAIAAGIAEHPSDVLRMLSGKLADNFVSRPWGRPPNLHMPI